MRNYLNFRRIIIHTICCSALISPPALSSLKLLTDSTVAILSATDGSGVIVDKKHNVYTVATAWHVISKNKPKEEVWVKTSDGVKHKISSVDITRISDIDLAMLKFKSPNKYDVLSISSNELPEIGMIAITAGWPLINPNQSLKITLGKVIASSGVEIDNGYSLLYTNTTFPGMSGGPIVNSKYELIGIHGRGEENTQAYTNNEKTGINQGVPAYYLNQYFRMETVAPLTANISSCSDYLAKANISISHSGGANTTLSLASKALEKCNDKSRALFLMAHSYRRLGDRKKAIMFYEKSLDYGEPLSTTLSNLAATRMELLLLKGKGKIDLALVNRDLQLAFELDPQNIPVINNLAILHMITGDKEKAIEILKYGLSIDHRNTVLHNNLKSWSD